jgi:predicted membrane protein
MIQLCPPALIYLIFSATQIIIDIFKGLNNTAFFKFIVMIMITFLLNALCQGGLSIIAWFIVFIPFILMSVIVTMLLYVFGLDVATGKLNYNCQNVEQNKTVVISTQPQFPVKVFNPNYNINPYSIPTAAEVNNYNNIAPVNQTQTQQQPPAVQATIFAPNYSSSPEYSS